MQIIKNIQKYPIEAQSIHYINSIGAIYDNNILLFNYNHAVIELESVRKVEINKSVSLIHSLFLIPIMLSFSYTLFAFNLTYFEKLLIYLYIFLLIIALFFIKKRKYKMYIRKSDASDIELNINQYDKEDAKRIAKQINGRIKLLKMKESIK